MDWFARFMAYAHGCFSQPLGYPECNALWGAVFLLALCVVGIVAIRLIYRVNSEEEQQVIEDIIKGRHPTVRGVRQVRKSDGQAQAPYGDVLGKIQDDANKATDPY